MTQVDDLEGLGHPDRFTGLLVISHLTLQIHPKDRSSGSQCLFGGGYRLARLGETLGAGVNVGVKKSEGVRPSAHSPFTLQIQIHLHLQSSPLLVNSLHDKSPSLQLTIRGKHETQPENTQTTAHVRVSIPEQKGTATLSPLDAAHGWLHPSL